ncbi:type VI secretion system baseplate subunit TssG [Methyloglobulus sp.]|uniref:type VI secretion system baseplate subunit TssG n=1 Tax=Methyloglobulus sp. TaxID=2518622 RepID=UPI0039892051
MASTHGNENADLGLLANLAKEPYAFGFYAALRQLECFYSARPRLGRSARPVDDPIRLGQTPSLQFAPSTLSSFRNAPDAKQLKVLFFGLFGPNGPLPLHLTEYTRNRIRDAKDTTLADFADMFHHRLLCLFYRAWADKEPTVQLDRPEKDRFAFYVGSLLGIGDSSLRNRDSIPDHTKLHFAAHLGCHTKHCEGLVSMLKDFFRVPVKIQEFIGEWLAIPKNSYCYLDTDHTTGQLGVSSVIGASTWQCQHKFRITMGPLSLKEYEDFLPTGKRLKNVLALVNNYVGFELNWDLNLMLKKNEVPATQLGKYGQLGWTSWLQGSARRSDANDLYLAREKIV